MNPKDLSPDSWPASPSGSRDDERGVPFGGYKQSGFGRDLGRSAVESCTETKSVCISI